MTLKKLVNADAGDADHWGGNDQDNFTTAIDYGEHYKYLIIKSGSTYYAKNSVGETASSNSDCGALMNTLIALMSDGDTLSFRGGVTYSGSTQHLNTTKRQITYQGNGATISGFTIKLNAGSGSTLVTGYCTFTGFKFSGASAGLIFDNTFNAKVQDCVFDTNAVGISFESSAKWSELWRISNCHFTDCTKSIVFKTPTGVGTGSYINGMMDHVTFNSSVIAVDYTFIEVQAGVQVSEGKWTNSRFWFNAAAVDGIGIDASGECTRCQLFKPYFENFPGATDTIGIKYNSGSSGFYYLGKPIFAGGGAWIAKISNASNITAHGPITTWRQSHTITPSATADTYGTVVSCLTGEDYGDLPNIYVVIGGTIGATETVTVEIKAITFSALTYTVTKTYTGTGTFALTFADYIAFTTANFYYVLDEFQVKAKSSTTSTAATITLVGFNGGSALGQPVTLTAPTITDPIVSTTMTTPGTAFPSLDQPYAYKKRGRYVALGTTQSDGILGGNATAIVVGTGASGGISRTATGLAWRHTTGATINSIGGVRFNGQVFTERDFNPWAQIKMRINQTATTRCFFGFTSLANANPTSGADQLSGQSGIMFGYDSGVNGNWRIYQNDATGTDSTTLVVAAADTNAHTFAIRALNTSTKFQYSYDGAAWVDINTKIPAATTALGLIFQIENLTGSAMTMDVYYMEIIQDI